MKPSLPTCCVAAIVLLTSTVWLSGDRVAQAVAAGSASPLPVSCDAQGLPRLLLPRLQFLSAGCSSCVGSGCCTGLGSFKPNVATGRSWPPVLLGAGERITLAVTFHASLSGCSLHPRCFCLQELCPALSECEDIC